MSEFDKSTLLAERLKRQGLTRPARTREEYFDLVRRLQPITPIANTRPGDPPRLVHRCEFDDGALADRMRAGQQLVKGRFAGGNVGYVLNENFELYANAFCRPMERMNKVQRAVLDVVERLGPVTSRQVKEETGLLSKEVGPALQRLQQAFLVFEEQADNDWERPWYPLNQVFPGLSISPARWEDAAREVIRKILHAMVFATSEQLRDWTQFPRKGIDVLLQALQSEGELRSLSVEGLGDGWMLADERLDPARPPESVFMLHKADYLVRAHPSQLKEQFAGLEALEYLLIDGEFQGVVCGHWGFHPYDVEDIVLHLSKTEQHRRREAIIMEVRRVYALPTHDILRYGGELL